MAEDQVQARRSETGVLLTTAQAAGSLGITRQWVNALVRKGRLHPAESPSSGSRTIAHLFAPAEIARFRRSLQAANVDWSAISSALDAWQRAKQAGDEQLTGMAHLETSLQMAKGGLITLLDPPALQQLSQLLSADDPAGIRELLTAEVLDRERTKHPQPLPGGVLRHSWKMILREMHLRVTRGLPPFSLEELEQLATEDSLDDALRQLGDRQLIVWAGQPSPPQITEWGQDRAEHIRYAVIRRIETPHQRMDWFDWRPSFKEAQELRDENARRYPDGEHIIQTSEGDWD